VTWVTTDGDFHQLLGGLFGDGIRALFAKSCDIEKYGSEYLKKGMPDADIA